MHYLGSHLGGRDNNLNLIRMIAASAVIVSHAFPLTMSNGGIEPLHNIAGTTLGSYAVTVFFCISGLLIARSFDTGASIRHWLVARAARLFPGLFVVLALTVFVLGPLVTADPAYWTRAETWTYLPRNLSLYFLQYPLPGVFAQNIAGPAINCSLWTLFYEVFYYGCVFAAGIVGLLRHPRGFACVLALFAAIHVAVGLLELEGEITILMKLGLPFLFGMAAWVYRDRFPLDWRIAAGLWLVAALCVPLSGDPIIVALCYTTLLLAFVPKGMVLGYNRLGDYSYGTYIYAYPMQQLMVHLLPGQDWLTNVALTFPPVLLLAVLSWNLVEKPSLALARAYRHREKAADPGGAR